MHWTFLYSDLLFYLVLLGITLLFIAKAGLPYWRMAWCSILSSRTGVISVVLLLSYFMIAAFDSIHFMLDDAHMTYFNVQSQWVSALDLYLAPMGQHEERSYVAPMAQHLFVADLVMTTKGVSKQYAALSYSAGQQPMQMIYHCLLHALAYCFSLGLIGALIMRYLRRKNSRLLAQSPVRWSLLLFTVTMLIFLFSTLKNLSAYFYVLGTNKVGQDVLYMSIKSIRTGILMASITSLLTLPCAVIFGACAGYWRGWVDDAIQYVYTVLNSIPGVLLIAASLLSLQLLMSKHQHWFQSNEQFVDVRFVGLCIIMGLSSWTELCRLIRAETLKWREMDFVYAAQAFGVTSLRILWQHIIPNMLPMLLITLVMDFSGLVLAEATLSYVGIGVDPSMYSWGNMINSARLEIARVPMVWWPVGFAFCFMFGLVLAANLFAEEVRQAFDPRGRKYAAKALA